MRDVKLPDGTWATTPIAAGFGALRPPCPDDQHAWEDFGPPEPHPEGRYSVQAQRCTACAAIRGRYIGDPHPEEARDEQR